jgi:glutamate N-acetyltransferase/amino-acid N-acetyltransferase
VALSQETIMVREIEEGTLLSVPGLRGAALSSGIKETGRPDLALVVSDEPVAAAGVFTRNALPAAPVKLCRRRLAREPRGRAVVINSGNANAMTGDRGDRDAAAMAERLEERCGGPALVLSTGIIGVPMPMDRILGGIDRAAAELSPDAGEAVAEAMLTTDTRIKTCAVEVKLPADDGAAPARVVVGGVAKGSGMIHPDMATMLAVIATDAPLGQDAICSTLRAAVQRSFNEITVDGDTSTNDTVLLLAGGAQTRPILADTPRHAVLQAGIDVVAEQLARMIVADGEGATRVMELRVTGARGDDEARLVARTVTDSLLVKTALAGGDPNWGRILAAAANAGIPLRQEELSLSIGGHAVFAGGGPIGAHEQEIAKAFSDAEVVVELDLGRGDGRARMLTSDITKGYVEINAEYHT